MKKILLALTAIAFMISVQACSTTKTGLSKEDRKAEEIELIKEKIESADYKIAVSTAVPMRGKTINLTSPYNIKIKGDSLYSYLPYYGRAYSVPYGGGKGLIFDSVIADYELTMGKKGDYKISFTTRTDEDRFQYFLSVSPSGTASLSVLPGNKSNITFMGEVDLYDKDNNRNEDKIKGPTSSQGF